MRCVEVCFDVVDGEMRRDEERWRDSGYSGLYVSVSSTSKMSP
jgi:hypothetical protein